MIVSRIVYNFAADAGYYEWLRRGVNASAVKIKIKITEKN